MPLRRTSLFGQTGDSYLERAFPGYEPKEFGASTPNLLSDRPTTRTQGRTQARTEPEPFQWQHPGFNPYPIRQGRDQYWWQQRPSPTMFAPTPGAAGQVPGGRTAQADTSIQDNETRRFAALKPADTSNQRAELARMERFAPGGGAGGTTGNLPSGVAGRVPKVNFNIGGFEKLRKQALSDALAAISANYSYQDTQAEAAMQDLAAQFERMMLENQQASRESVIGLEATAAARGLGHSGIYAEVRAQAASELAAQRAEIIGTYSTTEGEYGTMARDIESRRKLLTQQRALEESQAKTSSLQEKLNLQQMQAMINAGAF